MTSPIARDSGRNSTVERWVLGCCDRAWWVLVATIIVALAAAVFVFTHFSMTSSIDNLLSSSLPYRVRGAAFDRLFQPQGDQIVVVIDGRTPELADAAAGALAAKLAGRPDLYRLVQRPDGDFFAREGLLYESTAKVQEQMKQLVVAQPFLGPLAQDPSVRGIMTSLSTVAKGVTAGQAKLEDLRLPITRLARAFDDIRAGRPTYFSWGAMISGEAPRPEALRRMVLLTPVLDFRHLEAGSKPSDFVRQSTKQLELDPAHGVSVRLTGPIPLRDEQFGSLRRHAGWIAVMALSAILFMLWMAVKSPRLIAAILVTMLIGLMLAMACGLLIFGRFNVISVAFIPLFVGLGIDFGIQFSVRFRAENQPGVGIRPALGAAAAGMGQSLILAAIAIASGFLAFAPTAYVGVSQLGVIAGVGMFLAVALNLTFLPALIVVLQPPAVDTIATDLKLDRLDHFILSRRRQVLGAALVAAAASLLLLPFLHFDFNPFHLENTKSEAVSTTLDLMRDPALSPNQISFIAPSLGAANALASRVRVRPEVSQVRTLSSFVPDDQAPKLAAIADANDLLGISLDPLMPDPPPNDADVIASLKQTASDLSMAAANAPGPTAAVAGRLARDLAWLAVASPEARARAAQVLTPGLTTTLDETRQVLQAQPVSIASLPGDIRNSWLAPDGRARVSISPKGDSNDNAVLERFIKSVRTIAPFATGAAVGIYEGGRTIVFAFIEAGVLSFVAITLLLFAIFRHPRYVAITMAPIILTGLLTLGSCVIIGQPLNYANIIALPLLFGIGVAFHIYFVMAWRSGNAHLLQSSLTRAIFFSALATATGFGSLWASQHPGTASMGELLMISLVWTLVSALLFQPALMGPPPTRG
ncbi:MAG TPA: MMPL family transporter [Caulobacteraceae bacterium]